MAIISFVCSVCLSGMVLSLVPESSVSAYQDYHYVPYAGDSWGA